MRDRYGKHAQRAAWLITAVIVIASGMLVFWFAQRQATAPEQTDELSQQAQQDMRANTTTTDAALTKQLAAWADAQPANYGIVVREINGQRREALYQPDRIMTTASTYKVFLAFAFLHGVEQGDTRYDQQLPIGYSAEACLDRLLLRSENDCAYDLGNTVGWDDIDLLLQNHEYAATRINNYDAAGSPTQGNKVSTARDEALLMERLANGSLLGSEYTNEIVERLKQQIWRERVPAGVPEGVVVADKPGWLDTVQNDAAIVYGPKSTYVITIMSDSSSTAPLADLSKLVYDHLQK